MTSLGPPEPPPRHNLGSAPVVSTLAGDRGHAAGREGRRMARLRACQGLTHTWHKGRSEDCPAAEPGVSKCRHRGGAAKGAGSCPGRVTLPPQCSGLGRGGPAGLLLPVVARRKERGRAEKEILQDSAPPRSLALGEAAGRRPRLPPTLQSYPSTSWTLVHFWSPHLQPNQARASLTDQRRWVSSCPVPRRTLGYPAQCEV